MQKEKKNNKSSIYNIQYKLTRLNRIICPLIVFIYATLYLTHPLVFNLENSITGYGDELLIAWIQNWVLYSLVTNPLDLFNANIYFPYNNTLAYSETFITSSVFASVVKLFTNEPIATVNFTYITSLFTLGYSIFLLSHYISKDYMASLFVGIMVIFSPAVLSYSTHLQVLGIAGVPLAILFMIKYFDTDKLRYFVLACAMFTLQMYNSFLPGYFIILSWLIITLYYWLQNKKHIKKLLSNKAMGVFFISCLLIVPILLPYFNVSNEFKYARDIRESVHNAFQFEDFLYPGETTKLKNYLLDTIPTNQYSQNNEFKAGYLGFVFTIFVIVVLIYIVRNQKQISLQTKIFGSISLLGIILSLGPVLHLNRHTVHEPFLIPLPYALLYYILPGFQGFRTPVRWEMLFIIAIAVVIAIVLHKVLKRVSFRKKCVLYALLIICIVAEFNYPISYHQITQKKDFPGVYNWIQTTPKNSVIIEMPIYTWDMQPYVMDENLREYYSTSHFRKMVNGASGFSPPPWQSNVKDILANFPEDRTINKLSEMGVTYIIVHKKEYDTLHKDAFEVNNNTVTDGESVINVLDKNESLKLIKQVDDDYIYQIK